MKIRNSLVQVMALGLILLMAVPPAVFAQDAGAKPVFKQEELDQMLAPIALYPDDLLTQVLMASTYPLEVVQADRWAKKNKDLKGDALTKALEAQPWDPSVKSLVNFPEVLAMMSEKIDITQKLGDAFLAQQKDVLATIQKLRKKAEAVRQPEDHEGAEGYCRERDDHYSNLPTRRSSMCRPITRLLFTEHGAYPAYPPYPYYPPGYVAGAAVWGFAAGAAVGAAWGYAWGHSNWHGGNVDVDFNRNANINRNINRGNYQGQDQGNWQHNASHRGGVAYRDQGTAQKYNRGTGGQAAQSQGGLSRPLLNRGGRTFPVAVQTSSKAVRVPANVEAVRVQQEGVISPVRRAAALFQAWTGAAAQHVI